MPATQPQPRVRLKRLGPFAQEMSYLWITENWTTEQIADKFECSWSGVCQVLRRYLGDEEYKGHAKRKIGEPGARRFRQQPTFQFPIGEEEIVRLFKEEYTSTRSLSKQMGCSEKPIRRLLTSILGESEFRRLGQLIRKKVVVETHTLVLPETDIVAHFQQKTASIEHLSERYNASPQAITRVLVSHLGKEKVKDWLEIQEAERGRTCKPLLDAVREKAVLASRTVAHQSMLSAKEFGLLPEWSTTAKAVRRRDKYKCAVCGACDARDVHHLIPRRICHDLCLLSDNLICLCRGCHSKIEPSWGELPSSQEAYNFYTQRVTAIQKSLGVPTLTPPQLQWLNDGYSLFPT